MNLLRFLILLPIFFLGSKPSWGHEAPENSAAIVQHDRSIDIRLSIDMISWLNMLMPLGLEGLHPEDIIPRLAWAQRNLLQTKLMLNDEALPLEVLRFPDAAEILLMEKQQRTGAHPFAMILLRAVLPAEPSGQITMRLPVEMGPVIMSFSRPETQWVSANTTGRFQLKKTSSGLAYPWQALLLLGITGLLGWALMSWWAKRPNAFHPERRG